MKYRWGIWLSLVFGMLLLVSFVASAQLPAGISREETLVVDQLTGRVGMPNNFNLWAGWRNQDRGIQQLLL
jgi:peptide/nickel transport system substrate-binding protein